MEPAPAISIASPPIATLEYASANTSLVLPCEKLHKNLLWLSILSGMCVGSCFLVLTHPADLIWKVLHLCVFGGTLALAVRGGLNSGESAEWIPGSKVRMLLDLLAAAGLGIIGVAPFFIDDIKQPPNWQILILACAYASLTVSTWRHILLYRGLAAIARDCGRRRFGRVLMTLGVFKFLYETLWLACCTIPLLFIGMQAHFSLTASNNSELDGLILYSAFGALFGCMGFALVWIAMIIIHARCVAISRVNRTL